MRSQERFRLQFSFLLKQAVLQQPLGLADTKISSSNGEHRRLTLFAILTFTVSVHVLRLSHDNQSFYKNFSYVTLCSTNLFVFLKYMSKKQFVILLIIGVFINAYSITPAPTIVNYYLIAPVLVIQMSNKKKYSPLFTLKFLSLKIFSLILLLLL